MSLSTDPIDELLLNALDEYLDRRKQGSVDQSRFISEQTAKHPHADLVDRLPGLIASVDALHGFVQHHDASASSEDRGQIIPWQNLVATKLGDYEILDEVGRGGMGIVYKARQTSLDRIVALKVLPLAVVLDSQQIARFTIEAQAAGQLHHPHIVPIYWVGREEGVHCYSMPLIQGESLEQIISRSSVDSTHPSVDQCVVWMNQAAHAIQHAHDHGVIHRDIKPSNLLIDEANKLWVTDFGLARLGHQSDITHSGAVVGTFRYMSPEQASGNPALVDHRSDVYSLGVTFYELLTGRQVYEDDTMIVGRSQRRISVQPTPPRRLNPAISRDLETVLMKAMSIEPADRYDTADELAADLRRIIEDRPILARRPSLTDRMTKWTVRHRRVTAAAVAIGLITLTASLITTTRFARQQKQLQSALQRADASLLLADQNLRQAETNFRQTREVLDHFGLMAAEQLRGVAGAEDLREELVKDLLRYYESFVDVAHSNPTLSMDLAQTHLRAAKIIEEVGAVDRALMAYQRALELLISLSPDPINSQRPKTEPTALAAGAARAAHEIPYQIAICRGSIAVLQADSGHADEAISEYTRAINELTRLANNDRNRTRQLAHMRGDYGGLLASIGKHAFAKEQFEDAIDLLPEVDHRDLDEANTAAMIWNNLSVMAQENDLAEAIRTNRQAITSLQSAVGDQTADGRPDMIRSLAMSVSNQASLLVRSEQLTQACAAYAESIGLYRNLVQRSPMTVGYSEELAITYNNYARCLHQSGLVDDAKTAFIRSRDLLKLLIQRRPQQERYREALAGVESNLATLDRVVKLAGRPSE